MPDFSRDRPTPGAAADRTSLPRSKRPGPPNWVATLNRQKPDANSITEMLVALYLAGHDINWAAVHADASWRRIPLPTYPFQRKRHWIEDNAIRPEQARTVVERLHPLVGARIKSTC